MRVVLEHSVGPWAGMRQILGTVDQVRAAMGVNEMPPYIGNIQFGDHVAGAQLVGARRSYILYREIVPPLSGE
jgi:hypothetical protein